MIDLKNVSACLITKDSIYPKEVLDSVLKYPFGEILILTNCDSPHRKHELFNKTKYDLIYYQDDDAICPIEKLVLLSESDKINVVMKQGHFDAYKNTRMTMGLGWGSILPKKCLNMLKLYITKYGEDFIYKRETERILTYLNYPQNRLILPVVDLPSAIAPDRLSMQPNHYNYINTVEERCKTLI